MSDADAKRRLLWLTAVRAGGLLVILAGMLISASGETRSPVAFAGVLVMLAGLALLWLGPRALLRRWRTPR